jgi:hypothetical protein
MTDTYYTKEDEKRGMIKDILIYSDFYKNKEDLKRKDLSTIKSIYYSCLIPVFKGRAECQKVA